MQRFLGFELKRKILNTPGQGTPTVHDWWGPSHVTRHAVIDRVKIDDLALELTAGDPVVDGDSDVMLPGARYWAQSTCRDQVNLMAAVPLANGHRRSLR